MNSYGVVMDETLPFATTAQDDSAFRAIIGSRLKLVGDDLSNLRSQRASLEIKIKRLEAELGHLGSLLGTEIAEAETDEPLESPADLVFKLLSETGPMHYREIETELRQRGWYLASGADPANTLLSKFFRDARFFRPSRGFYSIRPSGSKVQSVGSRKKVTRPKSRKTNQARRGK
jgi:hypothetical protein